MANTAVKRASAALERCLPERRLLIRSGDHTRFVRLGPVTQLAAWGGSALLVGWAILATAVILTGSIGAGSFRAQALRDKMVYEDRLNELSAERDGRAAEAAAAQERFAAALRQVSTMQEDLFDAETRARELEAGLEAVQATLRDAMGERDEARLRLAALEADAPGLDEAELSGAIDVMAEALADTAAERDAVAADAEEAQQVAGDLDLEMRLMEERNDEIFRQLEDAMSVSVEPLDQMFRTAGLDPDHLIEEVRRGYSGQGGPLTPLAVSSMGATAADDAALRANRILDGLDRISSYGVAVGRVPFTNPLRASYRLTSAFGQRWGRMHEGLDMAGPLGTPVYATADGVVIQAGPAGDYGLFIKVQHEFGIETRYAHLSAVDVQVGQRVSRGEQIGDMGSTGRSTGSHLHYEIRVDGEAQNPSIYIGAGNDVL